MRLNVAWSATVWTNVRYIEETKGHPHGKGTQPFAEAPRGRDRAGTPGGSSQPCDASLQSEGCPPRRTRPSWAWMIRVLLTMRTRHVRSLPTGKPGQGSMARGCGWKLVWGSLLFMENLPKITLSFFRGKNKKRRVTHRPGVTCVTRAAVCTYTSMRTQINKAKHKGPSHERRKERRRAADLERAGESPRRPASCRISQQQQR